MMMMMSIESTELETFAPIEKELDRVTSKLECVHRNTKADITEVASTLDELLTVLQKAEQDLVMTINTSTQVNAPANVDDIAQSDDIMQVETEQPTPQRLAYSQVMRIQQALTRTNEKLQRLSADHRDVHVAISKLGKAIDRNLISDFSSALLVDVLKDQSNSMILNKQIARHYYRLGMEDVARLLINESKMPNDMAQEVFDVENSFAEIFRIWKQIQEEKLEQALEWATRNSESLVAKDSVLEFKLHRLAFLQILSRGMSSQSDAITYARNNFAKFAYRFEKEIPNLMGCLIYLPVGIENSPYKHLLSSDTWKNMAHSFMKDACKALGINKNSALSVALNAGCSALPALLNIKEVMHTRKVVPMWKSTEELPIEVPLGAEYQFHSIFSCPILRTQTTEDNPPKKLPCGHVVSKDAMQRLINGQMLKCPYCPIEQNASEAIQVYF